MIPLPNNIILLLGGVVLLAIIASIFKGRRGFKKNNIKDTDGYKCVRYIFTGPEFAFYKALKSAVQDRYSIMVKMRLADVIEIADGTKDRQRKFNAIAQKHCDFLLCERDSMRPLLFIELDDSSHQKRDRQERDQFVDRVCRSAGMPILHVPVAKEYPAGMLLDGIETAIKQR